MAALIRTLALAIAWGVAVTAALSPASAHADADTGITDAQKAQLEQLRAKIASQIQLQAYDLLDELVYGWTESPVFATDTPVVLADVSVPVGFGSGLEALVENHFVSLVTKNPRTHLVLTHCPRCNELIVYSGAKGTVVSRGVDQPEALAAAGAASGAHHALFLDFEAEGAALVLRARITSLEPALPIVYARTLSTSTASPALLRSPERLKSAAEARQEYLDALTGRGFFLVPMRLGIRNYAKSDSPDAQATPFPFVWLQIGAEAALTQARAWTASLSVGGTYTPDLHTGWLVQARIGRLLSGSTISLTQPDLYGFLGGSVITIYGPGATIFGDKVPTTKDLLDAATGVSKPEFTFAAFQLGLELRIKSRIGLGAYLEYAPALENAPSIGNYLDLGFIQFHNFGVEVTFCF
ncbi:MAG: hypothetical protein IRZ16_23360 [Myxococcaceae bacterium]|nr:hypothetical protein [Myxococcaceae bacterium]